VLGKVKVPLNNAGLQLVPAPGTAVEGEDHRPRECGGDTTNSIKQAAEFGIVKGGQKLAGPARVPDGRATRSGCDCAGPDDHHDVLLGPERRVARVLQALRRARQGIHPTMVHAGVYASVLHYLKAVEALKSDDGTKVVAKMKEMPTTIRCSARAPSASTAVRSIRRISWR
jgi:branched-chain amino acid transport system substrate-binding protein